VLAAMHALRQRQLTIEALWWQSRVGVAAPIYLLTGAGWLVGKAPHESELGFLSVLACLICATGSLALLHAVLDEEEDRLVAPIGPLPAGLLTRAQVLRGSALLALLAVFALVNVAAEASRFLGLLGVLVLAGLLTISYSFAKHSGGIASVVMATVWTIATVGGWLVAGAHHPLPAWLLCYAFAVGLADNIMGGILDIDSDPMVGNATVAVRLGARHALLLTVILDAGATLLLLIVAIQEPLLLSAFGIGLAVFAVGWGAFAARSLRSSLDRGLEGRTAYIAAARPYIRALCLRDVGLVSALSPRFGLTFGVGLWMLQGVAFRGSARRVREGGLHRDFARLHVQTDAT